MQHGRGSEIDGGTEWDVTEFAVLVYGMRISTALRTGYAATRTATATEQSHPMTITVLITNRNNKKNELNYTINFQLYHLTKDDYVKISVSPIFYTFTILFLLE